MPNPAMGLRAIRYCLAEPQMFLTQLRAILRASHYGKVKILLPMLAHAHEIEQTLTLIGAGASSSSTSAGMPYDTAIEVGGMIEIPAAALALPIFMRRLDFLSIGTNDLIQYTLAIDRTDDAVAHLYDPLHPAVLHAGGEHHPDRRRAAACRSRCAARWRATCSSRACCSASACATSRCTRRSSSPIKERILRTNLADVQTMAQRILRTTDPAKTRDMLASSTPSRGRPARRRARPRPHHGGDGPVRHADPRATSAPT